jgi:hypothetical protein
MTVLRCGLLVAVVGAVAVLLTSAGCGHRAAPPAPKAEPAAKQSVPLPDWAPKHPSPEFLRALRVLKPVPEEEFTKAFGDSVTATAQADRARILRPAAYEFFGSLNDEQVQRFLKDWDSKRQKRRILIPVKSMTPKQRAAFDAYVRAWAKAFAGQPDGDYLVLLYKSGAKQDLSNVRVGFVASGGHAVHVLFCIPNADGSDSGRGMCSWFAAI